MVLVLGVCHGVQGMFTVRKVGSAAVVVLERAGTPGAATTGCVSNVFAVLSLTFTVVGLEGGERRQKRTGSPSQGDRIPGQKQI